MLPPLADSGDPVLENPGSATRTNEMSCLYNSCGNVESGTGMGPPLAESYPLAESTDLVLGSIPSRISKTWNPLADLPPLATSRILKYGCVNDRNGWAFRTTFDDGPADGTAEMIKQIMKNPTMMKQRCKKTYWVNSFLIIRAQFYKRVVFVHFAKPENLET